MTESGAVNVHLIGKIDIEKYRCVTPDIRTDEVIITDERIQHIKDRHPNDFEIIEPFLSVALNEPDYILEDKGKGNSGLILKQIQDNNMRFQIVLRLHTSVDPSEFKNSVISAWRISESRWENYVNNKKILYKRE